MTRTRRGTAPLELALVLPLLFAIVYAGWWCVRAGLTKTAAASDARRTAWEKRADADAGTPFDLTQDHLLSGVEEEVIADVPGNPPFPGGPFVARAFGLMTDTPWAENEFEFEILPVSPISAHRKQLLHFGLFIPFIAEHGPSVKGFAAMDLMANGEFTRHFIRAEELRGRRRMHTGTFTLGPGWMLAAIGECAAQAASKPPLAGYYAYLARVIGRGILPSGRLVPETLK